MICSKCGVDQAESEYSMRSDRGVRMKVCKSCRRDYTNAHYAANRSKRRKELQASNQRRRNNTTRKLQDIKAQAGCRDCGEKDPVVLEFDHLRDKEFEIGSADRSLSWSRFEKEIAKCEVVCANCHRRRTHTRRLSVNG